MISKNSSKRWCFTAAGLGTLIIGGLAAFVSISNEASASPPWLALFRSNKCDTCRDGHDVGGVGGAWYWMRSPEQEKVVVASLYNRYCIRCHGVDGRGVWDIPGVPDFTNPRWQAYRSDDQIVRIIIEGRGAVMPTFRGTLSLEEAWAMARYLRSFMPGTEATRPDLTMPTKANGLKVETPKVETPKTKS